MTLVAATHGIRALVTRHVGVGTAGYGPPLHGPVIYMGDNPASNRIALVELRAGVVLSPSERGAGFSQ